MTTILAAAILVYGAMNLYALGKFRRAVPRSIAFELGLPAWGLLMVGAPFLLRFMASRGWSDAAAALSWPAYLWMGWLLIFCCISLAFDLFGALAAICGWKTIPWPMASAATLAALLSAYGFYDARHFSIERISIHTGKLGAGQKVTIAQISDLHIGSMLGNQFVGRIGAELCEIKPDIVVATGDIVEGGPAEIAGIDARLLACKPQYGAFAVTGNHEYYAGIENSLGFLRAQGFTVLRGQAARAKQITLVGVDDPAGLRLGQKTWIDSRGALAPVDRGSFVVLLKHQPVADPAANFDLQLSGHVHGGQIFPFNLLTRLAYPVNSGLSMLGNGKLLYVSRGAGTWGPPLRLFSAPEITLFTIDPQPSGRTGTASKSPAPEQPGVGIKNME